MAFTQKIISTTFILIPVDDGPQPTFSGGSANQVTLSGYRTSARIDKAGVPYKTELSLKIYGLDLKTMNQLSTMCLGPLFAQRHNRIIVQAGDESGLSTIFDGRISQAYTDLSNSPDNIFNISAVAAFWSLSQKIAPSNYPGAVSAATIAAGLASAMDLGFQNYGVSTVLHDQCLPGDAGTQLKKLAEAANFNAIIDNEILFIWPKGGNVPGTAPLISPETGLVGYPFPSGSGYMGFKCEFNPNIQFGGKVQMQSSITPANGTWSVYHLTYDLESNVPGGSWFQTVSVLPLGAL